MLLRQAGTVVLDGDSYEVWYGQGLIDLHIQPSGGGDTNAIGDMGKGSTLRRTIKWPCNQTGRRNR